MKKEEKVFFNATTIVVLLLATIGVVPTLAVDTTPPNITAMTCTPSSVLVGGSVTISCTVTDEASGVENVSVEVKDAKDRTANYTLTEGANNTFSYEFHYTGKSGTYFIKCFRAYDVAGNLQENATTLNFSAVGYSAGGGDTPKVATSDVNATVTIMPTPTPPPVEWIRQPKLEVDGETVIIGIGGVIGCIFIALILDILWNVYVGGRR